MASSNLPIPPGGTPPPGPLSGPPLQRDDFWFKLLDSLELGSSGTTRPMPSRPGPPGPAPTGLDGPVPPPPTSPDPSLEALPPGSQNLSVEGAGSLEGDQGAKPADWSPRSMFSLEPVSLGRSEELLAELQALQDRMRQQATTRNRLHTKLVTLGDSWLTDPGPALRSVPVFSPLPLAPLRKPEPPPHYDLDALLERGLEPGGRLFRRDGLTFKDSSHVPEAVVLADPAALDRMQGMVLDALARLGPLDERQLVRVSGLPEDVLEALLHETHESSADNEKRLSLLNTHRGLLTREQGVFLLRDPEGLKQAQSQAVARAGGPLQNAVERLEEAREVVELALPQICATAPEVAVALKPGAAQGGSSPATLLRRLHELGLEKPGVDEQAWAARLSADPAGTWLGLTTTLVSRVVDALHPVIGYEQLLSQMRSPQMGFPPEHLKEFFDHLTAGFGKLAGYDRGRVSNAAYILALGGAKGKPRAGPSAMDLAGALGEALARRPQEPVRQGLEQLRARVEARSLELSGQRDARIPRAEDVARSRAEREAGLGTPEQWARYLDQEYRLPVKILERLDEVPVPASEVVDRLELSQLTPEVAEAVRDFMKARLQGEPGPLETATRSLLRLKERGVLGQSEFGDQMEPAVTWTRSGFSSISPSRRWLDSPYHVLRSGDAETVQSLLGISSDAHQGVGPLAAARERLFEDLLVAHLMKDEPRLKRLRNEALTHTVAAAATRFVGGSKDDPFLSISAGGPMMACGGFDFGDLDRATHLGCNAVRAMVWAREHGRKLPLSPEEAEQACQARYSFDKALPEDARGIDFARLAAWSLDHRSESLPAEQLNELLGCDWKQYAAQVEKLQAAREPWVAELSRRLDDRPDHIKDALWRFLGVLGGEPTPEQGDSFQKLVGLHQGDLFQALDSWRLVEKRVAGGESAARVIDSMYRAATGLQGGETPAASGGVAEVGQGLAVGGAFLRMRRRTPPG